MDCMEHTQGAGVSIQPVAGSSLSRLATTTSWMERLGRCWPRTGSVEGELGLAAWSGSAEHRRRTAGPSQCMVTWWLGAEHHQDTLDPGPAHSSAEISSHKAGVPVPVLRPSTTWTGTWLIATTRDFTFPIWRPDTPRHTVARVPPTTPPWVGSRHRTTARGLDIIDMTTIRRLPQYPTPPCHPSHQDIALEWPNKSLSRSSVRIFPISLEESGAIEMEPGVWEFPLRLLPWPRKENTPQQYCSNTAAILQQYCSNTAVILQQYCSNTAEILQQYCSNTAAILQHQHKPLEWISSLHFNFQIPPDTFLYHIDDFPYKTFSNSYVFLLLVLQNCCTILDLLIKSYIIDRYWS